ncbi:2Fe-2S iron-sulfur cluster-binding protein [Streptomyces sp. NPDC001604]|uniref:2Fe-2S iron-sulfur cluster-binding protein n=1 Tax=Streptomyces sp. NPDC001604 TaxID=3364593 RepID=UPI0036BFC835
MTHVVAEATAAGRHTGQLHTERFAAAAPPSAEAGDGDRDRAKAGDGAKAGVATEFTVRIASTGTGHRIHADRTPAEVLTAHGVEVELSCERGICGACLTPVLAGERDHRDEVQTPDERASGGRITVSRSRARSPELLLGLCPGVFDARSAARPETARHRPGLAPPTFLRSASSRCRPGQ